MANVAALAQNFVALPGSVIALDKIEGLNADSGYVSRLENVGGKWLLTFKLNTAFAENYDRLALVGSPSTRNVLKYALLWSAHRLYESWALTHALMRQPMNTLPNVSPQLRKQFVSLQVKRDLILQQARVAVLKDQKPQLLKIIMDAMDAANTQDSGYMIDADFIRSFNQLAGLNLDDNKINASLPEVRKSEQKAFQLALVSLLNLVDLSDWVGQSQFLIFEAKRLAVRWFYLANSDSRFNLSPEAHAKLEALIENRAITLTNQLFTGGALTAQITQSSAAMTTLKTRNAQRVKMQTDLITAARAMQNFATQKINLMYLLGAQRNLIEGLNGSQVVTDVVEAIKAQKTYLNGYEKYKELLFSFMQVFSFSPPLSSPLTLTAAFASAKTATWNPAALSGAIDKKYIDALNEHKTAHTKDLQDLIRVGQLLKFDIYEKSINPKRHGVWPSQTPNSLGLKSSWLESFLGSERADYLLEMKKDLISNSPLLGGKTDSQGLLWEALVKTDLDDTTKYKLADDQLGKVWKQINTDNASLEQALQSQTRVRVKALMVWAPR